MAGIVGLMLAANRQLTPVEVKNIIRDSCKKIDKKEGAYNSDGHSTYYGYGRIDAGLAVSNALKSAMPASGPAVTGVLRFSNTEEQKLHLGGQFTGNFEVPQKLLGFSLKLKSPEKGMKLRYRVNVPGRGIVESRSEGDYVGAANGRQRIIGFAVELEGATSKKYDVQYAARLKGVAEKVVAENGQFCGTDKKSGKTIEAILIRLKKRQKK